MNEVTFDKAKIKRFQKAYEKAILSHPGVPSLEETFVFEGNRYVFGYAKYLIQYLESRQEKWSI